MVPERFPEMPRPRTLVHPGEFNPVRIQHRHCRAARHFRLLLEPGLSLFDAMVRPLARLGVESASTTLLGGFFERLLYCVAQPDPSGQAVIAYSVPRDAGRSTLVFGNATLGKGGQGEPLVHCHAAVCCEDGRVRGGHVVTTESRVGPVPIPVLVTALEGFELRVAFDPETNIPLIQPTEACTHD